MSSLVRVFTASVVTVLVAAGASPGGQPATAQESSDGGPALHEVVGEDPSVVSVGLSRSLFPTGASTVYIARRDVVADALAAGPLTGGPILLVEPCTADPRIGEEIQRLAPSTVVALGGTAAVCDALLADLADGRPTDRLAGPTRLHTASTIARYTHPDGADVVYLASAADSPDAVAGATLPDGPILLTDASQLSAPTLDAIDALDPTSIILLGGTAALSATVEQEAAQLAAVGRLAGPGRAETAVQIATRAFGHGAILPGPADAVQLVEGTDLAGAVAAGTATDGPTLLVPACGELPDAVAADLRRMLPGALRVVGEGICPELVAQALDAATPPTPSVRDDVVVLTSAAAPLQAVDTHDDGTTTLTLTATAYTDDLAVGDIVAIEADPTLLPSGWVVDVRAVTREAGQVELVVRPADLDEVLSAGLFRLDGRTDARFDASISLSASHDIGPVEGSISASLDVDPILTIDVGARRLDAGVELGLSGELEVEASSAVSEDADLLYRDVDLPPWAVPGGGIAFDVPSFLPGPDRITIGLVFLPAVVADVTFRGTRGRIGLAFEQHGRLGFRYDDGDWSGLPSQPQDNPVDADGGPWTISTDIKLSTRAYLQGVLTLGAGPGDLRRLLNADIEVGAAFPVTLSASTNDLPSATATLDGFANVSGTLAGWEVSTGVSRTLLGPWTLFELPGQPQYVLDTTIDVPGEVTFIGRGGDVVSVGYGGTLVGGTRTWLRVYGPDGNQIASRLAMQADESSGVGLSGPVLLPNDGRYTVEVTAPDGGTIEDARVQVTSATPIELDEPTLVAHTAGGTLVSFEAQEDEAVAFGWRGTVTDSASSAVFGSDGFVTWTQYHGRAEEEGGGSSLHPVVLRETGTHYAVVHAPGASYTDVTLATPTRLAVGGSASVPVNPATGVFAAFEGVAGQTVEVGWTGEAVGSSSLLVAGPDGAAVELDYAGRAGEAGQHFTDPFELRDSGTHWIRIGLDGTDAVTVHVR